MQACQFFACICNVNPIVNHSFLECRFITPPWIVLAAFSTTGEASLSRVPIAFVNIDLSK